MRISSSNSRLVDFYYRLPYPLRSLAATLYGYRLRAWRYGAETERLIQQVQQREHWDVATWKTWCEQRLEYVLHRAATKVPYYAQQWSRRRQRGDNASWQYLENWPVLEKESLRNSPRAFLAEGCDPRRMYHERTSGTTGMPLDLWRSRQTMRARYALFEVRYRGWYGVSRHDRWAMLGGQLVTPVQQRKPPFWVWNGGLRQLYLSSYHLAPDLIPYYLDALRRYRIKYLWGYSSSLNVLAQEAIRRGVRLPMTVVITNAEPLFDHQRQAMEDAFQCPVRETYGMAELVAAASQCEAGRLHLWPEVGSVEVLPDDSPSDAQSSGRLICTGLLNADMPLVRYAVGDRGTLDNDESPCPCGRNLPRLSGIEGRNNDLLITRDGRPIYWLNPVFYGLPIHEAQIVQESLDRVHVRLVATGEPAETGREIARRLQARLGDIHIELEEVDHVPREMNGKFRAVVCNVPPEQRQLQSAKLV
jgi:phenylacetate-CoA ligase